MTSNSFNSRPPRPRAPPYCKTRIPPFPPVLPPGYLDEMNAYARWTDLDPLGPVDVAAYTQIARTPPNNFWIGSVDLYELVLEIALTKIAEPNNWTVYLTLYRKTGPPETRGWVNVKLDYDRNWDSGTLYDIHIPRVDYREARVMR